MNDEEMIREIIKRNEKAFEEFLMRYGGLIKSIVRYHLKSLPMWQEDCINDVCFALWQNLKSFNPDKNSLKNYVAAVAKYRTIDYKRKYIRSLSEEELPYHLADESEAVKCEIQQDTKELLAALSPSDREIFIRRYINGEDVEYIALSTKRKPSQIYNRLSRGRRKLKAIYGGGADEKRI
ncbi:MAG: sigma-70 family RNA polymerase sigma factor [Clostridia bacterium]